MCLAISSCISDNSPFVWREVLDFITSDPQAEPLACIIWMHGLGSDAQDMEGLAGELKLKWPVRHIFLNAPVRPVTINNNMEMRAWYDIKGANLTSREDKRGIEESESLIKDVMKKQLEEGFSTNQLFLAGFSQGGAMAFYTGLNFKKPLAGIVALSGYLPLSKQVTMSQKLSTPMFAGYGQYDDVVNPEWTQKTIEWVEENGMKKVESHIYPMAHAVCLKEINDLTDWFNTQFAHMDNQSGGNP